MYSIVKLNREKGVPRTREEISNDEGYPGELRFTALGGVPTATLHESDDEFMRPLVPVLEHAQLIAMAVDMMRFRGIERAKDGAGYEQEWSVQIVGYEAPEPQY